MPDQAQQLAFKSLEEGGVVIDVLKRHGIDKRQQATHSRQTYSRDDPFSDPNHLKKLARLRDEDQEKWLAQMQQVRQQATSPIY